MLSRKLQLSKTNSFFLFGARGVGKSTLTREHFKTHSIPVQIIDLLKVEIRNRLLDAPDSLEHMVLDPSTWVLIDEVQKVPDLLDVVHRLIEERQMKFCLTGSSARKLKHGGANLLAGRAFVFNLFPLTSIELADRFSLEIALKWGTLPRIFALPSDDDKIQFLKSYANTYIQEEVWEAHLIKDLVPYRRFLQVAAQANGTIINYANIADDTRVDPKTVQRYFQILEETLLGFFLQPYHRSLRKRQRANPKFFFFDIGVQRALTGDFSSEYGRASLGYGSRFEHFVICEVMRLNEYHQAGYQLSFARADEKHEVDLVLSHPNGKLWLIEIKSTDLAQESHLTGLRYFKEKFPEAECELWSLDPHAKKFGVITAISWQSGLKKLFAID
jgi:predicted AAA+ superfamily ATPase